MQGKTTTPRSSYLYREMRHNVSRGLAIDYAAMERQVNAITSYSTQEKQLLRGHTQAFIKVLSHV